MVLRSALVARTACQVLTAVPSTRAERDQRPVVSAARFRRANFENRYHADGGHASTGWSLRYRITSAAKSLAVS